MKKVGDYNVDYDKRIYVWYDDGKPVCKSNELVWTYGEWITLLGIPFELMQYMQDTNKFYLDYFLRVSREEADPIMVTDVFLSSLRFLPQAFARFMVDSVKTITANNLMATDDKEGGA